MKQNKLKYLLLLPKNSICQEKCNKNRSESIILYGFQRERSKAKLCYFKKKLTPKFAILRDLPRLRRRPKLLYDQTQSSAHPCVPRQKLKGLDRSSGAQQSGPWSGVGLVRGQFSLKNLIIGVFERTWV